MEYIQRCLRSKAKNIVTKRHTFDILSCVVVDPLHTRRIETAERLRSLSSVLYSLHFMNEIHAICGNG